MPNPIQPDQFTITDIKSRLRTACRHVYLIQSDALTFSCESLDALCIYQYPSVDLDSDNIDQWWQGNCTGTSFVYIRGKNLSYTPVVDEVYAYIKKFLSELSTNPDLMYEVKYAQHALYRP